MRLCVLGSGSSGNCIYVASSTTGLLIDAGLSGKATVQRLQEIGVDASGIHAICLTHEHSDHISSLRVLQRKFSMEVYANTGTMEAVCRSKDPGITWKTFLTGQAFAIGDLSVEPFSVSHDAHDPVGFVIGGEGVRIGIITDIGCSTSLVRERMQNCSALVIECNHDEEMLRAANRPWSLKQRISGRQGHLSNAAAAEFIAGISGPQLSYVFLAHMSSDCNEPGLAVKTVEKALIAASWHDVKVLPTYQRMVSEVWEQETNIQHPTSDAQHPG